jgi:hypothetical protein
MAAAWDVGEAEKKTAELGLECGAGTAELRKEPSGGTFSLPFLPVGTAGLGRGHGAPTTIQTDAVMLQCSGFLCSQKNRVHVWQHVSLTRSLTLSLPFSLLLVGGLFPIGRAFRSCVLCPDPSSPSPSPSPSPWLGVRLH